MHEKTIYLDLPQEFLTGVWRQSNSEQLSGSDKWCAVNQQPF